jgi:guanine nucleotide-binding protein G(i) subunit alpha
MGNLLTCTMEAHESPRHKSITSENQSITDDDTAITVEPLSPSSPTTNNKNRRETFLDVPVSSERIRTGSVMVPNSNDYRRGGTSNSRTDNQRRPTVFGKKMNDNIPSYKILLLGTGETGKSTMVKQLKLKYDSGFEEDDKKQYKVFILCNVITALGRACSYMIEEDKNFANEDSIELARGIIRLSERQSYLVMNAVKDYDQKMYETISALWSDRAIERTLRESIHDFHVCDAILYFFDNLDLMQPPFEVPTETQVMQASRKTTGIVQQYIQFADMRLHIVDVGGQRNERKKWKNAYPGVNMVLFVVALSDYDQQLYEDESINRMQESLDVFEQTVNEPAFKDCPFFLIFNKVDSFQRRMEEMMSDLHVCFPEYNLGSDHKVAMKFIEEKFVSLHTKKAGNQKLYIEYVNAINNDDIDTFFDKMRGIIQENASSVVVNSTSE